MLLNFQKSVLFQINPFIDKMELNTAPVPGDLVFAKVKGFPSWPARVQARLPGARLAVFFYGTFETATVWASAVVPYNAENRKKFSDVKLMKRKTYVQGMDRIELTPEIAPDLQIDEEVEDSCSPEET